MGTAGLRSWPHARVLSSGVCVTQRTPSKAGHALGVTCAQCVVQAGAGFTGHVTARMAPVGVRLLCCTAMLLGTEAGPRGHARSAPGS